MDTLPASIVAREMESKDDHVLLPSCDEEVGSGDYGVHGTRKRNIVGIGVFMLLCAAMCVGRLSVYPSSHAGDAQPDTDFEQKFAGRSKFDCMACRGAAGCMYQPDPTKPLRKCVLASRGASEKQCNVRMEQSPKLNYMWCKNQRWEG